MDPLTPQAFAAALGCAIAVVTDVRTGKIHNALTFPMMAVGLVMNASLGDWMFGAYGLVAATLVHYPLWLLGVQKAGDAKLIMGIGALLGPWFVLECSLWYALVYIPVGAIILAISGNLRNMLVAVKWMFMSVTGMTEEEAPPPTMLRTAPIITAAAIVAFLTPWFGVAAWGP